MKSKIPNVLHEVAFKPLVSWVLDAVSDADERIVAIGHDSDKVKDVIGDSVQYVCQQQYGTAYAVMQAREIIENSQCVLILTGNTPLITKQTLDMAYSYHKSSGNCATVLSAHVPNPFGYGRIVRNYGGNITNIIDHNNANADQLKITEVNSGIYFFNTKELLSLLEKITYSEYNVTDIIEVILGENKKVGAFLLNDHNEILGINDRAQLAKAGEIMRKRIVQHHMENGVTFISPETAYISGDAVIGSDTIIMPNTMIEGKTTIGEGCVIGPNSRVVSSEIGAGVEAGNSVILNSEIGDDTHIGPFAYIRPDCRIGKSIKIGDFVEVKNSVIDDETKISHLTYVGDADVGKNVNFGCGTVIVNYDGRKKHRSTIGDNAFIGCNTNLVSPVNVGNGVFIAAGSTITDDIPENAFAIARSRQTIKTDWKRK